MNNEQAKKAFDEFGIAVKQTTDQLMQAMRDAALFRWQKKINLVIGRLEEQGLIVAVDLESGTASVRKPDVWVHHCTIDYGMPSARAGSEIYNWLEGHIESSI